MVFLFFILMDGLSKYACLVDFMGYADKDCEKDKIFVKIVKQKHQQYLNGFNQKQNRSVDMTNAEKIRSMSDEELAEFLDIVGEDGISSQYADVPCDCCCEKTECSKCWKEWLQSEAE